MILRKWSLSYYCAHSSQIFKTVTNRYFFVNLWWSWEKVGLVHISTITTRLITSMETSWDWWSCLTNLFLTISMNLLINLLNRRMCSLNMLLYQTFRYFLQSFMPLYWKRFTTVWQYLVYKSRNLIIWDYHITASLHTFYKGDINFNLG